MTQQLATETVSDGTYDVVGPALCRRCHFSYVHTLRFATSHCGDAGVGEVCENHTDDHSDDTYDMV